MLHPCPRPPCPDCGADDALALRATYHSHPPLPLRWLAPFFPLHLTRAYACATCHHLVLINTIRPHAPALAPPLRPPRLPARTDRHGRATRAPSSQNPAPRPVFPRTV